MIKGKTSSGFEYEVDENTLDDWEFVEILSNIDKGLFYCVVDMAVKILGEDQYERLKSFIKEKEGKISIGAMEREIIDIFQSNTKTKNL